jgi:hypothetical protein
MFDINILISWNQSINEWINQLNIYIEKTDYFGLYILGEEWSILTKELRSIYLIEPDDISKFNNFINFIDYIEKIIFKLNKITNGLINKSIINYSISNMDSSYKEEYDNIVKKIQHKKVESDNYIQLITNDISDYINLILKNNSPEELIDLYESTLPHEPIIMEIYLEIIKKYKKNDLIEPYKGMLLGVKKDEFNIIDVHPIQKINYLIQSITNSRETKKGINISINDKAIEYNVLPLISKIDAVKFGPISYINTGLTKSLVNRFKNITVNDNILNNPIDIETTVRPLSVYTGYTYKQITPVNFKEGHEWKPAQGVNFKTYKYNQLLESIILKNMKIDNNIYKSFKIKDHYQIVSNDVLKGTNKSVSEICYSELEKLLNKKLINEDKNISREMYLLQFFNINKIIESIRKKDEESIEIIPLTKMLAIFKLI